LLPASTALATFSDVDISNIWSVIQTEISQLGIPEAAMWTEQFPQLFEKQTGL